MEKLPEKGSHFLASLAVLLFTLSLNHCAPPGSSPVELGGKNLISGVSLASWVPDDLSTTYMNYQDETGTYSPPAEFPTAEVYRLEIKNLIPNGDFEATAVGLPPAGWTVFNGGGAADIMQVEIPLPPKDMNNKALYFKTDDDDDRIEYEPTDAVNGSADGFIQDASYIIRYLYRTQPSFIFEYNDGVNIESTWNVFSGIDGAQSGTDWANLNDFPPKLLVGDFPEKTVGASPNYYYMFGSLDNTKSKNNEGYIDNFRLIRTDIPLKTRLTLDQYEDFQEQLVSGTYSFSIYVKDDPTVGVVNNRLRSERVSLGIKVDSFGDSSVTRYQGFERTGVWANWIKLTVRLYASLANPPDEGDTVVLSLCSSDDTQGALSGDVGSVLISSPILEIQTD
jgi:hypothetical protein